ncbi:MAG: nucleotide exchange factor GrpE [Bacteroidales bacterium]|nr:nucleotide exchange factor GrpE [Bacteroidales bacterium]
MKDDKSQKAAEELENDLHRVDEGEAATFDDIQEASDETAEGQEVSEEYSVEKELEDTKTALEKEKKEYLFLMADFDNYRKRVMKEKADLVKTAAEKVLKGLLPIVDDFERGLDATKDSEDASAVREGMELIYNKLVKYLNDNGVKAMDTTEATFDADLHEAIASVPTGDESKKGKIIDTTQKGYTLNDKVLRHAKVVVGE